MTDGLAVTGRALTVFLATLAAVVLPQAPRLGWWVTGLLLLVLLWRHQLARLPGRGLRLVLVAGSVMAALLHHGLRDSTVEIFVTLLICGVVLRSLEVRTPGQARTLCALALIALASVFIYNQSIPMAAYGLLVVALILATWQVLLVHPARLPSDAIGRNVAALLLLAAPLMLVLFLAVPRIGPLWAMPAPDSAATSGVSDQLSPGGITSLGMTDELAFRVSMEGDSPDNRTLYWRGLALDEFEEGTWSRSRMSRNRTAMADLAELPSSGEATRHDLIMEPSGQRWLYTRGWALDSDETAGHDRNLALYAERRILQRQRFTLTMQPGPLPGLADGSDRWLSLRLPDAGNPRARELAGQWTDLAPRQRVEQGLAWFRDRPFRYTLEPPAYTGDTIDTFLFDGRAGFCGHYASAFAWLMRVADVPARVVVGYQGGERNPYDPYLLVHQYNAHAWVEVWLDDEGWVRVDPTTTVAPERIESGAEAWLSQYGERSGIDTFGAGRSNPWLNALRLRLDAIQYAWNRAVINFDSQTQLNLLESLTGERSERLLRRLLIAGLVIVVSLLLAVVLLSGRGRRTVGGDPVLGQFAALLRTARVRGGNCSLADTPAVAAEHMGRQWPGLADELTGVAEQVSELCFATASTGRGDTDPVMKEWYIRRRRLSWRLRWLRWRLLLSHRPAST